jgi:hypothetical protein
LQRRDVKLERDVPGGGLVTHHVQDLRCGSDEDDAFALAGGGEVGVLGEEAVAGVDGIDAFLFGQRDDAFDIKIGSERAFALSGRAGRLRRP